MMTFLGRALRTLFGSLRDSRGLSLYEVTAAVAMTAIIAAVAIPVALDRIEDAKKARATLEVEAISKSMLRFFQDTGKWPGELEMLNSGKGVLLKSGVAPFPAGVLEAARDVKVPQGAVVDCPKGGFDSSEGSALNINDFLVNKPRRVDNVEYANWRGPYMDPVDSDPFDKAYIIHVLPLFCGEAAPGTLGYGWALSAGPDQTLQQSLLKSKLDVATDDSGRNSGKRTIVSQ